MNIELPHMPSDPEPGAIFLQELAIDLAEAADPSARWRASFETDGIALSTDRGGFRIQGGEGWRIELHGTEALRRAVEAAIAADPRVLRRISPD